MRFPRLSVGAIYLVIAATLLAAALGRREHADAPAAPPPPTPEEGELLAPPSVFDPAIVVKATPPAAGHPSAGSAFSVSDKGVWITARHVVMGCSQIGLMQSPGHAAAATLAPDADPAKGSAATKSTPGDVAVLLTKGGAPPVPIAGTPLHVGARGFMAGYPQGAAGEVASRLLGRQTLLVRAYGRVRAQKVGVEPVLSWAEAGRTDGLIGDLSGLSGAPVLNEKGEAAGVVLAQSPRRGRLYTTPPEAISAALQRAGLKPGVAMPSDPVTVENYGRAADALRRDLRVVQVVCLD